MVSSQDGFYQLLTGPPYTDLESNSSLYNNCPQYLEGASNNDSVNLAFGDDTGGRQQFLIHLVQAPDQYTITLPRCPFVTF